MTIPNDSYNGTSQNKTLNEFNASQLALHSVSGHISHSVDLIC